MWAEAWRLARKDLRIEFRSRVAINQIAPFGLLILVLFAFAFDSSPVVLRRATPGLLWLTVLFAALLMIQRSFGIETADGLRDGFRMSGVAPSTVYLGKMMAVVVQLLALEVMLIAGLVALFDASLAAPVLLVPTVAASTLALAAVGCIFGSLVSAQSSGSTLLPMLMLPMLAPMLLCASQATDAALNGSVDSGWKWLLLLVAFAGSYTGLGMLTFGVLSENS